MFCFFYFKKPQETKFSFYACLCLCVSQGPFDQGEDRQGEADGEGTMERVPKAIPLQSHV